MRKSLTLWIVSLLVVVLALPAFAQDTTGSYEATSAPAAQPTVESMPQAAPAAQATAQTMPLNVEGPLLADYISANFTRLGAVIQAAGLADTLNSAEYTIFVPNDGAFQTLLNELGISLEDLMGNPALLQGLTYYHVVPGRITSNDILNGSVDALETVHGAAITFGYDPVTSRVTLNDGAASIEQPDIVVGNGMIHIIDNVLLPPNVADLLANPNPEATPSEAEKSLEQISEDTFVVLTEAVKAAGLEDELSSGEYTLFAPNDGAFLTLLNDEDMSYADLLANQTMLQDILTYHLVPGTVTAEQIADGEVTSAATINGATLNFGFDNSISRVSINGGEATIEQPDIFASNGVVHIIDNVLLPPQAG
jgi:uncharacterized surface protein with fasciclin (FAS1) repeats